MNKHSDLWAATLPSDMMPTPSPASTTTHSNIEDPTCQTPNPKTNSVSNKHFCFKQQITEEWGLSPITANTTTTFDITTENFPDNTNSIID